MQSLSSLNGPAAALLHLANPKSASRHSGGGNAEVPATRGPLKVGKYLVSPLVKVLENGWFASSVSIRSGSGSGTTDRVLRLTRIFRCAKEAAAYAHAEGLRWIGDSHGPRWAATN